MEKLISLVVIADTFGHYPDGSNARLFSCEDIQVKGYAWIVDGDIPDPDCADKFLARAGDKGDNSTTIPATKVLELKYREETIFVLASKTQLNDLCQNCCTDSNAAPVISGFAADDATPAAGANVTLTVTATDDDAVTKVEFYEGDMKLGEDAAAPFTLVRSFQAGTYFIVAKVIDNKGKATYSDWLRIAVG